MNRIVKINLIQWFIKFIGFDLSKISEELSQDLIVKAIRICAGQADWDFGDSKLARFPIDRWGDEMLGENAYKLWVERNQLRLCQIHLKNHFEIFMDQIAEVRNRSSEYSSFRNNSFLFSSMSSLHVRIETPVIDFDDPKISGDTAEDYQWRLNRDVANNTEIRISYKAASIEDTFVYHFFLAVEGMPLRYFLQCPVCGKYFFNPSNRKKIFCSGNCRATKGMRDMRQKMKTENPEAYEAEKRAGRNRARRSYVNKVKHGKPARRQYKYKDD